MSMTLADAPLNTPLTCLAAAGAPELRRRLAELGIRRGARVLVRGRTSGGGRMVQVAGATIAMGRPVLAGIEACPVADTPVESADPAHRA